MASIYKLLGDYIEPVELKNSDGALDEADLRGISVNKEFIDTHANLVGVTFEGYKVVPAQSFAYIPDTSRRGDRIAIAFNDSGNSLIVSSICTVFKVVKTDQLDSEYLNLWFNRSEFDRYARFKSHGSAREVFDWDQLCAVELPIPEIDIQQKIVSIKNCIDLRAKALAEQNDYLAELLLALQKQIAETEELTESRADEVFNIHIGKTPPRKEPEWFSFDRDGNVIWMSIKDMGGGDTYLIDSSEYLTPEAVDKHNIKKCKPGSVLLSFKLTVGRVGIVASEMVTNEAIACFSSDDPRKLAYLYPLLKSYDYASLGSTSSIATAVNSKMIKAMGLKIPSSTVLDAFYERAKPIYELLLSNTREIAALNELRDTLLPKLMSGEIDVSKVDLTQLNNHLA